MEPSKTLGRFRMEGPVYGNKESDGDISSQYSRFQGVGHFSYFHYLPYNLFGQFSTLRTSRMHTPPSLLIKIS
jgi:hypothetical protein